MQNINIQAIIHMTAESGSIYIYTHNLRCVFIPA